MSTQTLDQSTATPNRAVELTLLLVLAGLWGGSYTFIKLGVETIPPLTLIAARTLIAGVALLAVMRGRDRARVEIGHEPAAQTEEHGSDHTLGEQVGDLAPVVGDAQRPEMPSVDEARGGGHRCQSRGVG